MRFAFLALVFLVGCASAETVPPPMRPAPVYAPTPDLSAALAPPPPPSAPAEPTSTEKPPPDPVCNDTQGPVAALVSVRDVAAAALLYPSGAARAPYENWIRKNAVTRAADARAAVVYGVGDRRAPVDAMASAAEDLAKRVEERAPYDAIAEELFAADERLTAACSATKARRLHSGISPETIQLIIRSHVGPLRQCYQALLRRDPKAHGRVVTKFVIDRSGAMTGVEDGGSDLLDPAFLACRSEHFRTLRFPKLRGGGTVTVVYPITFSPED